jgi:rod shape determining protein RodA
MKQQEQFTIGIDWLLISLYVILLCTGILCIFMVEYNPNVNWISSFLAGKTAYSKQFMFAGVSLLLAVFILFSDSKLYTGFANLSYLFGIFLMLLTFVIGKNINGSRSWIPLGKGFNIQPAELCIVFTSLALAKYISLQDMDFSKIRSQLIATAIALFPAALAVLQNETGLAIVYFCFFIVMFREGLPGWILIVGFSFAALVVATLVVEKNTLAIILTAIAVVAIFVFRKIVKKNRSAVIALIIGLWGLCVGVQRFAVPYLFNNVFQCYQSTRIYAMVGKIYDCSENRHSIAREESKKSFVKPDDYNVRQSKIAIGSGGLLGKGFLKGTQTRGKYVQEQQTDFIFTSLGEAFGFAGTFGFLMIYLVLLFRIVWIAERQRSVFSRVYAYCVASVFLMHITINVCMTIGLFPVVGIPLPFMSYGGSSLVTFTVLLFILIRIDADRQMILR